MKLILSALLALSILSPIAVAPALAFPGVIDFPRLTFPDPDITPSTKGCAAGQHPVCTPKN